MSSARIRSNKRHIQCLLDDNLKPVMHLLFCILELYLRGVSTSAG